jgi:hypothetical protein
MTICIGLCVCNNAVGLPFVFDNIERIQSLFTEKINIIVAYDESYDTSLGIILSKLEKFNIYILKNQYKVDYPYKTGYICDARNLILKYIRDFFPETEYLIMMDSNEYACIGNINLDILREALDRNTEWDAVSFDCEAGYYDYWALSFDPFIYSIFHTENVELVLEKMRETFMDRINAEKQKDIPDFIPVYSAYNGFAIYKWQMFQNSNYSYHIDTSLFPKEILEKQVEITNVLLLPIFKDAFDCEHRYFHLKAIHDYNAKIRIYPKSIYRDTNHVVDVK